jgi:hypothetical protein
MTRRKSTQPKIPVTFQNGVTIYITQYTNEDYKIVFPGRAKVLEQRYFPANGGNPPVTDFHFDVE